MNTDQIKESAAMLAEICGHLNERASMAAPIVAMRVAAAYLGGHDDRTMSALGDECGISRSRMTWIIDSLEVAGLVERSDGEDRRVKYIHPTNKLLCILQPERKPKPKPKPAIR